MNDISENGIRTSLQGSLFHWAPEVIQTDRKGVHHGYNEKIDIWSLGCVVLEMWTVRRPWQDSNASDDVYEVTRNCYKCSFQQTAYISFLSDG